MPNAISFNHGYPAEVLECPMEFATDKGKSALERLMHLWGFDDDEKREGWEDKSTGYFIDQW